MGARLGRTVDTTANDQDIPSSCPVKHDMSKSACPVHNKDNLVGSDDLSKERTQSSILGKSENQAWVYPSSDMFYKALKKKNKADEQTKEHVDTIVSVHNAMNEDTWRQILQYEALNYSGTFELIKEKMKYVQDAALDENLTLPVSEELLNENIKRDTAPRLLNFIGRPHDLTPKAMFEKYIKGNKGHFDRHDWVVQRRLLVVPSSVVTSQRRYVIDYYYDESKGHSDEVPKGLHDAKAVKSIRVDARPALDSFSALFDRLRFKVLELTNNLPSYDLLEVKPIDAVEAEAVSDTSSKKRKVSLEDFKKQALQIKTRCKDIFEELEKCESEEQCAALSLQLMACMGQIVCTKATKELANEHSGSFEENISALESCLANYEAMAKNLK